MTNISNKHRAEFVYRAAALLVIIVLGFIIYSNTFNSPFFYDDRTNISENPHIRLTQLTVKNIIAAGLKSPNPNRSIANISFAMNYYFHRYEVFGYHLINVAIHILTAIFLYFFVKGTLSVPLLRHKYNRRGLIAFFTACIWLVHPIQTQAVTYIVQRMTSLAAMFYILSMLLYVKGRIAFSANKRSWRWFAGCALSGVLSFGCKETAATLPLFILLYEFYFFQNLNSRWLKDNLLYVIAALVIFAVLGFLYFSLSPTGGLMALYPYKDFTLTERLITQPRVLLYYITLLIYPSPNRLNLDHDFAVSHSLISPPTTIISILIIFCLIILIFYIAKKQPLLSFCILWFFGNLAIESSFIGLQLIYEHRLYLPSTLVLLAAVAMLWRFIKRDFANAAMLSAVALLFCFWTYQRNHIWADPVTLWADCAAKSPRKARPPYNLAYELQVQGRAAEAISQYRESLRIEPNDVSTLNNLGFALQSLGKTEEAIEQHRQVLQIDPNNLKAHNSLAAALHLQGKLDEAISHCRQALKVKPDDAPAHYHLGNILIIQGKLNQAISHYLQAAQSDYAPAQHNLGIILQKRGKVDEAIGWYRKAIEANAEFALAHYSLGNALASTDRIAEAIDCYQKALDLALAKKDDELAERARTKLKLCKRTKQQ